MIHQVIFSGHVAPDLSQKVEQKSVEEIYNYCEKSGITGLTLYMDGGFFCITEGTHSAVQTLKGAYEEDQRLSDIVVLLQDEREHAEFEDFKIGICKRYKHVNFPHCFSLNTESLKKLIPDSLSDTTKILTKTFARVNNLSDC